MNEPLDNKVPKTGMSEEKSRKLKHVKVYDQLYAQILSGISQGITAPQRAGPV